MDDKGSMAVVREVATLVADMRNLSSKMDKFISSIEMLEARVRDLEAFKWKLIGMAVTSGGAGVAIGKFLMGG